MQSDQATLLVTEINGISLSQQWINDTTKPVIGVDMLGYSEDSAPLGLVGVEYPVFPANAFDSADGHTAMSVEVYKNYQTGAQQKLSVENGKFLPETTGEYSIVYSSADKSGNKASKVIKITVVDTLEEFSYSFNKSLKLEYKLGEYFAISAGKASGGSGNAQATVSVIAPNGEVIEEPNGALIDQEGTYVVRISFEDFIGRKQVISYTVTSTISPSPIIYEASLPTAFINGSTYILPDFYAVDYSTGTLQEPTKSIKVVYNGVETVIGEDRKFTPHVENHQDTVKIVYAAENENGMVSYYEYLVKILIVSNESGLDMSAYFALDNMTAGEKTASYVEFLTSTEGAGLTFVNPLIASGLSLEVYVPKAKNKFSSLTITLTDALDSTIATSFTIYKHINNANYSYLEHNGEKVNIAGNFFDLTSYGLSVSYNNTSRYLFDRNANKNLLVLSTNLDGEEFNGFPSGKVYMSMKINGVEGESSLQIRLIGNQNFSNLTTDRVLPQIQLSSFITRTMEIGEQLKVPAAIAADVLSKDVTLKVTIKKGSKVLYTGSIDEDFYYIPDQYGSYRIEYSATAGNRTSTSAYFVEVKDRENPTLTLSGAVPTTGNIGKVITLPTAMVADNHSQNLRVWIYITEPTGRMITLEEGATTFVPQMSGRYRVTYYVHDDYANYVYEKFIITVQ
jgi:hypothetical protein